VKLLLAIPFLFASSVAVAQGDRIHENSDGCVSTASLKVPTRFAASQVVKSRIVVGTARYDYWWARCNLGPHKHFHDFVLAFRVTALTGSYVLTGNNYLHQANIEWSVPKVYSGAFSGQLIAGGAYSHDIGIISGRTMGFRPGDNPHPDRPVSICAGICSDGQVTLPAVAVAGGIAVYDPGKGTLRIPAVRVNELTYSVELTVTRADPMTLVLTSADLAILP
jgi:hypothetical protein